MKRVWAGGVALFGGGALAALTTGLAVRSADGDPRTLYVLAVAAAVLAVICGAIWFLLRGEPTANGGGPQSGRENRTQTARADGDSRAVAVGSIKGDFHYHEAPERPHTAVAPGQIEDTNSQVADEFNELIEEGEGFVQAIIHRLSADRSMVELWRMRCEGVIRFYGNRSTLTDFKTAHQSQRQFQGVQLQQPEWDRIRRIAAQVEVVRKCRELVESAPPNSLPARPVAFGPGGWIGFGEATSESKHSTRSAGQPAPIVEAAPFNGLLRLSIRNHGERDTFRLKVEAMQGTEEREDPYHAPWRTGSGREIAIDSGETEILNIAEVNVTSEIRELIRAGLQEANVMRFYSTTGTGWFERSLKYDEQIILTTVLYRGSTDAPPLRQEWSVSANEQGEGSLLKVI